MSVATYDAKSQLCSFNGVPLSGFSDGTHIEIEHDEEAWFKKTGNDGETARARNRNRGGKVTFTLMTTSSSNDVMSGFYALDQLASTGSGVFMMKDASGGTTIAMGKDCWIQKLPKMERGKEIGEVKWVLDVADLEMFIGGNS